MSAPITINRLSRLYEYKIVTTSYNSTYYTPKVFVTIALFLLLLSARKRLAVKMSSSFYAVKKGRIPGIYSSWDACLKQVDKYGGAIYKKFKALNEAELFINNNSINHIQKQTKAKPPSTVKPTTITKQSNRYLSKSTNTHTSSSTQLITEYSNTDLNKPNDHDSYVLYTDGGCSGNQSVYDKRCPAGWGVVILYVKKGQCERDADIIAQLYGPVVLDEQSPYYLGATVGTLYYTLTYT